MKSDVTVMTALWSEVFAGATIEPATDFFDLGGSSMQAITLVERIEQEFGVRLPVTAVLEEGTPTELVALVHRSR